MKQTFKGRELTTVKMVNNILRIYDQSENRKHWYFEAHYFAKMMLDDPLVMEPLLTLSKVCGIIAALSPLKSWEENKRIAHSFLTTGVSYHTGVMTNKAKEILASNGEPDIICDILKGNKITSFFLNIYDPKNVHIVTIDRHAQDILLGGVLSDKKRSMTLGQYKFFVNCYCVAANKRGVVPNMMQSVTWEKWREIKKNK